MIAPNIDIPPGLEEAYYNIVRILGGVNPDTIIKKKGSPAKKNYSEVGSRSLFVRWESLWATFDTNRLASWTSYWYTLPFGDHSGFGGWPGSGFSAFIYVNAPRYQLGLDPLLDPPVGNLISNPSFGSGGFGWFPLSGTSLVSPWASFLSTSEGLQNTIPFALSSSKTYRFSAFVETFDSGPMSFNVLFAEGDYPGFAFEVFSSPEGLVSFEFSPSSDVAEAIVFFGPYTPYTWAGRLRDPLLEEI